MAVAVTQVAQFWSAFDLTNLQKDLDDDAEEINRRREAADLSRKSLVEATRAFRAQASDDMRKQVAPMMKKFQAEVDTLSKRSKLAETAFLNVYKRLATAPDPAPLIDGARSSQADQAKHQELLMENQKLKQTIEEYHTEFAEIKNQEVTINRLKEKLKEYDSKVDSTVEAKVKEKERQLQREFSMKEKDLQEQTVGVATKLGQAEHQVETMRAALDAAQTELFEVRTKQEEETHARAEAWDMLQGDLDRALQRTQSLQKELELERERMAELQNSPLQSSTVEDQIGEIARGGLERELAAKEKEATRLIEEHRSLQQQQTQFKMITDERISNYEQALEDAKKEIEELRAVVEKHSDYDDVKKELRILQSVEFGASNTPTADGVTKPLELLLLEKTRNLEAENTQLKISSADHIAKIQQLERQQSQVVSQAQEQESLISQLEGDLASTLHLRGSSQPVDGNTSVSNEDLLSEVISTGETEGPSSILAIVTSQRDRFRTRNVEVEAENRHLQQTITSLRNEVDTLRSDNMKLYEKIKYVQAYPGRNTTDSDSTVTRYSAEYEEHINPFKQFGRQEKHRRLAALGPLEKFSYSLGRLILSNKYARMIFLAYAFILHILVFLVLYKYSHHAVACGRNVAELCMTHYRHHLDEFHHFEEDLQQEAVAGNPPAT